MGIFTRLQHLMPDAVQVEPRTGEVNATPTYGSKVTVSPCQVTHDYVRVRDGDGNTIVGQGYIVCGPTAAIGEKDRVTLPARLGSKVVLVTTVLTFADASETAVKQAIYG